MQRRKANYGIQRGGYGIPLDNNTYLLRGRSHKNGGIDIGRYVEAQGGEVVRQFDKAGNNVQILSKENNFSLGSPAKNYLTGRMSFDQALNYQQAENAIKGRGDFAKAKWGWDDIVKGAKKVKDDISGIVGKNVKEYKDRYTVNRGNGITGSIANLGNLANTIGSTAADLMEYADNATTHNKNVNTGDPMAPMITPYNYLVNALPVSDRTKKTLAVAPFAFTGKKSNINKGQITKIRKEFANNRELFDKHISELSENDVYNVIGNDESMFDYVTQGMKRTKKIPSDRTIKKRIKEADEVKDKNFIEGNTFALLNGLEARRNKPIKEFYNESYIKDKKKGTVTFKGQTAPGEPYQTFDGNIYRRGEGGRKWIDAEGKEHITQNEPLSDIDNPNHNFLTTRTRSAKPWKTNRKYTPWDFKNNKPKGTPAKGNETAPKNKNNTNTNNTEALTEDEASWLNNHPNFRKAWNIGKYVGGAAAAGSLYYYNSDDTSKHDRNKKAYGGIETEYDRISRINHNDSLRAGKHRQRGKLGLDDINPDLRYINVFDNSSIVENPNTGRTNINYNNEQTINKTPYIDNSYKPKFKTNKFKDWWNNKAKPWFNDNSDLLPYGINAIGNIINSGINYGITKKHLDKIKPFEYTPNINVTLPDFDEKENEVKLKDPKYLALQKFASGYDIGGQKQALNREKARSINSIIRNSSSSNNSNNRTAAIRDNYIDKMLELLSYQSNKNKEIENQNIARNIDIMKTNVAQHNEHNKMLADLKNRSIDRKLNYNLAKANFDFNKQSYIDKLNYDIAKFNDERNYNTNIARMNNSTNLANNLLSSISGFGQNIIDRNNYIKDRNSKLLMSDIFTQLDDNVRDKIIKDFLGKSFYKSLNKKS